MTGGLEALLLGRSLLLALVSNLCGVTTCSETLAHLSDFSVDTFFGQDLIRIRDEDRHVARSLHGDLVDDVARQVHRLRRRKRTIRGRHQSLLFSARIAKARLRHRPAKVRLNDDVLPVLLACSLVDFRRLQALSDSFLGILDDEFPRLPLQVTRPLVKVDFLAIVIG